jgi:simple sugar transport system permease protein
MSGLITGLFSSMLALCVPLLIAAEGEVFVEHSGQFNMGIEGMMMLGALSAFAVTIVTKSTPLGLLSGALTGGVLAAAMFLLIYKVRLDLVVVAIVFNLLAAGITGFLSTLFIGSSRVPKQCEKITDVAIPFLSKIPVVGPVLFARNYMVYAALAFVPVVARVLFRTRFGLELRAVGSHKLAASTMGINVSRTQFKCFVIGGLSGGLAGAYMSLTLGMFVENMTMNKGFIALALCTFSRGNPYGTLAGALLFTLADSLQLRLQLFNFSIPYEFLLMLPYALTIVVLAASARRGRFKKVFYGRNR